MLSKMKTSVLTNRMSPNTFSTKLVIPCCHLLSFHDNSHHMTNLTLKIIVLRRFKIHHSNHSTVTSNDSNHPTVT